MKPFLAIHLPALMLLAAATGLAATGLAADGGRAAEASEGGSAGIRTAPEPNNRDDPGDDCFQAALDHGDLFHCDLAVQVAGNPPDPEALTRALVNRSLVQVRQGRLEDALADLDMALQHAAQDPAVQALILGNRGNLLLRMGRPADALAAQGQAIELMPEAAAGYYNRAFVWRALGDDDRAQADVDAAASRLSGTAISPPASNEPDDFPDR